jgi:hypothetical protein
VRTRNLLRWPFPLAAVLAAGLATAAETPPTPLGKWMKPNVQDAETNEDFVTLQKSMQLLAAKPPPGAGYPAWIAISKAAAAAAAAQDLDGVKKGCHDCHGAYKAKYKKEQATRPFP